jgi:nicotinamide-nucleotide amidase
MSARAGIVVTGTEVLTGRVADRNGPWLSDRLRELGVDHAHTVVVGDRREDMESALRFLAGAGVDLIVTSGGLGPTADDLTAEVVGEFQGRRMVLDEALEGRISAIVTHAMRRWPNVDPEAMRAGSRKQAIVPAGATILEPVGTAPGLVAPPAGRSGPTVVVLPGPPRRSPTPSAPPSATPAPTSSARCACSACRSPRSPRPCARRTPPTAWTASRSRRACATARSRS